MATNEGGIANFLKQVRKEIEKTTWPTGEQVKKALVAVAIICLVYALLAGVFDALFGLLMKYILQL